MATKVRSNKLKFEDKLGAESKRLNLVDKEQGSDSACLLSINGGFIDFSLRSLVNSGDAQSLHRYLSVSGGFLITMMAQEGASYHVISRAKV